MKRVISFVIFGFLLVFMLGVVSAGASFQKTIIAGKIYNSDYTQTVGGADVVVLCNEHMKNATSLSDGAYSVSYNTVECDAGDDLTVSASHPNYGYGSETGIIHDNVFDTVDLAIVNVPLVPEFGLIVGLTTIIGAMGLFFFVRKK